MKQVTTKTTVGDPKLEAISHAATLEIRIAALETALDEQNKRVGKITEAFRWAANQIRPIYGMSHLAGIFDGIADTLDKS